MLGHDLIYFPNVEQVPDFAMAFTRMMFAHADFEEQVREMRTAILKTRSRHGGRGKKSGLGTARDRPGRMEKLISDRPGLVEKQEALRIRQTLVDAIDPCDQRNLLAHGRWWRFVVATSTIKIRGERKGEPAEAGFTVPDILAIAEKLKTFAINLERVRSDIERRRGDDDQP